MKPSSTHAVALTDEELAKLRIGAAMLPKHWSVPQLLATVDAIKAERERLRFCLDTMISYLGHQDQDADHAWMVKKMRGALNGEPFDAEIAAFLAEEQAR